MPLYFRYGLSGHIGMVRNMMALSMPLANGGKNTYTAMPAGATTFKKLNPLGSATTTAYDVIRKKTSGASGR